MGHAYVRHGRNNAGRMCLSGIGHDHWSNMEVHKLVSWDAIVPGVFLDDRTSDGSRPLVDAQKYNMRVHLMNYKIIH